MQITTKEATPGKHPECVTVDQRDSFVILTSQNDEGEVVRVELKKAQAMALAGYLMAAGAMV